MKKQGILSFDSLRFHYRQDLHLARKAWHLVMGLLIVAIYLGANLSAAQGVQILGGVFLIVVGLEWVRLSFPKLNQWLTRFWAPLMRSNELYAPSGTAYYVGGALLAVAVFPKPIAALAILYLACGDPVASAFGILYGKHRFKNGKSLEGAIAGTVVCALTTFVFLGTQALSIGEILIVSLVGGLAGGASELLPLDLDDNLVIPVFSGFVLWIAFISLNL